LGPFAISGAINDGQTNSNFGEEEITGCAVSSSSSSRVQHVTCTGCGASVLISAETGSHLSQPLLPSVPGGFTLTAEEFKLLEEGLEQRLWHKQSISNRKIGNIQWDRVEQAFASKADNRVIFKRSASRLQSSYSNFPTDKKRRLRYGEDAINMADAAAASSSSLPLVQSSDETIPSAPLSSNTDVTMLTNLPASLHPAPASSQPQPQHTSSSASAPSNSNTHSSSSNSNFFELEKKSKNDLPFSEAEKKMIKQWGLEKVGAVDRVYLFSKHKEHFYETLRYVRHGEEMVQFWKNTDERKSKKR
jgi:hypothetical protein